MSYNDKESYFEECDPEFEKLVLLEAISLTPQTVAGGLAIPFATNLVSLGNGIIHTPGGTDFNLVEPGVYKATFTGSSTPLGILTGIAFALNGSNIAGTPVFETVIDSAGFAALATQTIVQVAPCISTVLTVVNSTAEAATFTNPNVIIQKIG